MEDTDVERYVVVRVADEVVIDLDVLFLRRKLDALPERRSAADGCPDG